MSYAAVNEETSVWLSEAGMGSWSLNHKCHFHKQVSHRNPNENMTLLGWTMAPVSDGESCSPLQLFETIHALYRICLWWDLMDPNLLKGKSTWIQYPVLIWKVSSHWSPKDSKMKFASNKVGAFSWQETYETVECGYCLFRKGTQNLTLFFKHIDMVVKKNSAHFSHFI